MRSDPAQKQVVILVLPPVLVPREVIFEGSLDVEKGVKLLEVAIKDNKQGPEGIHIEKDHIGPVLLKAQVSQECRLNKHPSRDR